MESQSAISHGQIHTFCHNYHQNNVEIMTIMWYYTILKRKGLIMTAMIGQKIKKLREMAGLSQEQIARFLDIDQSTISKCEKGERQFQIDQLEQLGSLFGCALADLMNEEMKVKPLCIAFRANAIANEDLLAIADIHKIALNLDQMSALLQVNAHEVKDRA
jgi:transcriptional regulator with XRE-family HTH domain